VYSFGVLCYEVFARGALPFHQIPDEALILKLAALPDASVTRSLFGDLVDAFPPAL
jgi:hypothetical protein